MNFILIAIISFIASLLTFFSGFGLGTLLSPVFVLFFPVQVAIAGTALVHLTNNLFKLWLMYRHIRWDIFVRFSIPAGIAAIFGALLLNSLGNFNALYSYTLLNNEYHILPIKLTVGLLFILFSIAELSGRLKQLKFEKNSVIFGGLISGFFGGLTGNQGALRTAFLVKFNLTKEAFIATGVVSSCVVDILRISIYWYGLNHLSLQFSDNFKLSVIIAIGCAVAGAILGRKLLTKISMQGIRVSVAILMILVGFGLAGGLL